MKGTNPIRWDRRRFIYQFSLLVIGGTTVMPGMVQDRPLPVLPRLWDPFSKQDENSIEKSKMARLIIQYPEKNFSCAESIFLAALKHLDKPDDWAGVAGGFGGGLGQGELCGLLTGGIMAIGVAAGKFHHDRTSAVQHIRIIRKQYWDWWSQRSPIHCRDMRIEYNRQGYLRMIQRVAARLEELITPPSL